MKPHLAFAHQIWRAHLMPGDTAIDATCGHGHDAQMLLDAIGPTGELYCIDIQDIAIASTKSKLSAAANVTYIHGCHTTLPPVHPHLIVYNLGYLPHADHRLTTQANTTLESLHKALELLPSGGLISMMLYTGHPEGNHETQILLKAVQSLPRHLVVTHTQWLGRPGNPSLLLLKNTLKTDLSRASKKSDC